MFSKHMYFREIQYEQLGFTVQIFSKFWKISTWGKYIRTTKAVNKIRISIDFVSMDCTIDCPLSKGNQVATPKIERPNGKNTKSKIVLKSVIEIASLSFQVSFPQQFLTDFKIFLDFFFSIRSFNFWGSHLVSFR